MPRKSKKKRVCKKKLGFIQQHQKEWWKKEEEDGEQSEGPKWVTHYCSDHQILLVGDGDFSFSLSLAKAFGSASNIVASSLDTYDEVIKKYKNAKSNLEELQNLGAYLLHGVDATAMKFHPDLKMQRFDCIIFNFPHAGFHRKEDNLMMIKMHMDLVFGFFKNACHMLRANGEIHVNHKTTPPFDDWNIEKLAKQSFLTMIDCIDFNKEDYPGYDNKRGDSYRCDDPFPLGKCSTFKFICNPRSMKKHLRGNHIEISRQQTILPFHEEIQSIAQFPPPVDLNYLPRTSLLPKMNQFNCYPQTNHFPKLNEPIRSEFDLRNGYNTISREINNVTEIHGSVPCSADGYRYPQTNHFPKLNEPIRSEFDLRNGYNTISREINNVTEIHGSVPCSADGYRYPQTNHFPKLNEPIRSEFDLRNGYNMISREISNVTEIHGNVACSADGYRYARDMTQDTRRLVPPMESLQSLQPRPTPTICRYSLTEPLRRTMDMAPPMSLRARNGDHQYKAFEGSSSYMQEELYRNAQRPSYFQEEPYRNVPMPSHSFDIARYDLERYNAEVPRRVFNREIYAMQ